MSRSNASELRIGPGRAPLLDYCVEVWRHHELIGFFAWRDVKLRYRQTALGAAWALLQPLLSMVVLVAVLGRLQTTTTQQVPYSVFVYSGMLVWTFVANSITLGSSTLVANPGILKKVYFPRLTLPIASVVGGLVDLAVGHIALLAILLVQGVPLSLRLVSLALPLSMAFLLALSGAVLFAGVNVRYRDVKYALPFLLQLWFFASPVFYSSELLPAAWQQWVALNPMVGILGAYRGAIGGSALGPGALGCSAATLLGMLLVSFSVFRRLEHNFADEA